MHVHTVSRFWVTVRPECSPCPLSRQLCLCHEGRRLRCCTNPPMPTCAQALPKQACLHAGRLAQVAMMLLSPPMDKPFLEELPSVLRG